MAVIEWWADQNPNEIPPTKNGTKIDAPRAKVKAYLNVRLKLGDKTDPVLECFERLYSARMRVFKAALRDSLTDGLREDALHFALSLLEFEVFGHFEPDTFHKASGHPPATAKASV